MQKVLPRFVTHLQERDRSPNTIAAYRRDVTGFFAWLEDKVGEPVALAAVTPFDVQKYRDTLVEAGRSPATLNRKLAALRAFFKWAVQQGLASSNPVAEVQGTRYEQRRPKALDEHEVYRLQRTAAAQRQLAQMQAGDDITPGLIAALRDEALVNLLLYTGLRVSEAAQLRCGDLEILDRSGNVTVRSGKGRKYRRIHLHKLARKALSAYLEIREISESDFLFLRQRGRLGPRGIQLRIKALGKAAHVEVTPHVLRHTFATRLLREAKVDLVTVSELVGHSSITTTQIYTQPSETDLASAIDSL